MNVNRLARQCCFGRCCARLVTNTFGRNVISKWTAEARGPTALGLRSSVSPVIHASCRVVSSNPRKCDTLLTNSSFDCQFRSIGWIAVDVVSRSPSGIQPYLKLLRIDRPIGTWLLFWPGGWSIGLAASSGCLPDFELLFLFGMGALVMRGAGCVINDILDKNIDAKVSRTRDRPIASGQISRLDAFVFLSGVLAIGDVILMNMNWESILLGASSLGLIVTYPLMKRFFNWPQLFLGFVFNWGALLGWTAVQGTFNLPVCLSLYVSCISWTLIYDTMYALQDKKDDVVIGVKSTALTFGSDAKKYFVGFTGLMATGLTVTGILCDQTYPYYVAVALATGRLLHQIATLDVNDAADCGRKFTSNRHLGWIIMIGIILGTLLKEKGVTKIGSETKSESSYDHRLSCISPNVQHKL